MRRAYVQWSKFALKYGIFNFAFHTMTSTSVFFDAKKAIKAEDSLRQQGPPGSALGPGEPTAEGFPWWSGGYDSALPMQGA